MIVSDNAKTFQASANEIQKVIRSESVQCYLTNQHIDWQFIVEKGPWWGNFWEKLVKSVKHCLKKTHHLNLMKWPHLLWKLR